MISKSESWKDLMFWVLYRFIRFDNHSWYDRRGYTEIYLPLTINYVHGLKDPVAPGG